MRCAPVGEGELVGIGIGGKASASGGGFPLGFLDLPSRSDDTGQTERQRLLIASEVGKWQVFYSRLIGIDWWADDYSWAINSVIAYMCRASLS
jgi:hypothetical protein